MHEADTATKNKESAKKVDDFEDGRWPKNNLRIIYFVTRWKQGLYDCSTYVGSFIVNEGACCKCTRAISDEHCTTILFKDERETKERDRRIVDIYKSICQHSTYVWDDLYMKEDDDCRVKEKITKEEKTMMISYCIKKYFDKNVKIWMNKNVKKIKEIEYSRDGQP